MLDNTAFESGKNLKIAIIEKGGNLESVAYRIKEASKRGPSDLRRIPKRLLRLRDTM